MKHVTEQNIAALAQIAVLCAAACLSLGFSPAVAAMLSRGADLSFALAVTRSLIYPLCANKSWLPSFGACTRASLDRIIALF